MTPAQSALLLLVAGIGLAFANTLASSGSALSLPVLLAVGLGPELANGTNRVAVLAGATAATVTFVQAGRIQWRIVRPLMVVAAARLALHPAAARWIYRLLALIIFGEVAQLAFTRLLR